MSFLNLGLLIAGVSAIAIPIIIHLLMRRRRRPVKWGAMQFLLEAYRRQRRRLMMERWLLLLVRCLLLALLGFALGRPLLSGAGSGAEGRTLYVLIDDSIAAGGVGADGEAALERHKRGAIEAIEAFEAGSLGEAAPRVALVTLGAPSAGVVVPGSSDLGAIRDLINELSPTDARADLAGAMTIVGEAIGREREARGPSDAYVVLLSDFFAGSVDLASSLPALPEGVTLVAPEPESSAPTNVAIVGLEPLRSVLVTGDDQTGETSGSIGEQVRVRLRRSGPGVARAAETRVSVRVGSPDPDGWSTPASTRVVAWKGGEETRTIVLPVTGRVGRAGERLRNEAVLIGEIDSDALVADDLWRRPIEVRTSLRVGVVAPRRFVEGVGIERLDSGEWARLALRPSELAGVDVVDLDPGALGEGGSARLSGLDALVITRPDRLSRDAWDRINAFLDAGGLAIVTTPSETPVHLWADAMRESLGLGFALAREAEDVDLTVAPPDAAAPGAADGAGATETTGRLLGLLAGELGELLESVNVQRVLPPSELDDAEPILMLADGRPLLIAATRRSQEDDTIRPGMLIYLGTALDLEWTNLPARALMVPLMQELVRQGVGQARGRWFATAGARPNAPGGATELVRLDEGQSDRATIRVDSTGAAAGPIRRAGVWRASNERGGDAGHVVVNADVRGSVTEPVGRTELSGWLAGGSDPSDGSRLLWQERDAEGWSVLASGREGTPIALMLLIGALVFALFETLLARRSSHAEMRPARTAGRIGVAQGVAGGVSAGEGTRMGGAA